MDAITKSTEPVQQRGTPLPLEARHFRKVYYPTITVSDITLSLHRGDILALAGANGAGKSTLIKTLSGVVGCDGGELTFDGSPVNSKEYHPAVTKNPGIRVVYQKLSLCKNLTVYENFYVEQSQNIKDAFGWRKQVQEMARAALDRVFPGHGVDVAAGLDSFSIAQQQMVEIARATSDKKVKLMTLDEPTSSLPIEWTEWLQEYSCRTAGEGMTYTYISHHLKEIMTIASYVYIMQNGSEKWKGAIHEISEERMVKLMGEGIGDGGCLVELCAFEMPEVNQNISVICDHYTSKKPNDLSFKGFGGQILGLTGLEGNGRLDLLRDIFLKTKSRKNGIKVTGKVAFVIDDRKKKGTFPLWSIADNQVITKAAGSGMFQHLSCEWLEGSIYYWYEKLHIRSDGIKELITCLPGGNQQKVLTARAPAADADIILLDDPTRGVDQPTKNTLYEVFREAAAGGKLVIWRTSDDVELEFCTHLLVLNGGQIVGSFEGASVDHETIMRFSFQNEEVTHGPAEEKKRRTAPLYTLAPIAMVAVYVVRAFQPPMLLNGYGLQLMVMGFVALMLCALGQIFIIGLGHIDLGIGNFCGLINVLYCTLLLSNPTLGALALLGTLALYPLMGYVIYKRNVPAIIVTLGMSFLWMGAALSLQAMPGSTCPEWIRTVFYSETPLANTLRFRLAGLMAAATLFYRSHYGTVLREFGNSEHAMINPGWSKVKALMVAYALAGILAFMAGVITSAINDASDSSASGTYIMFAVASVIIGGGYFSGGVVAHFGAVYGAVILTMISVLLGLWSVSTDYTALIQGLVLILILSLRLLKGRGKKA